MALDWQEAYDHELTRPFPLGGSFEIVINRIWEHGILAHIAPQNVEVFKKREEESRPVWRRNDQALYWRILYSARYAIYACDKNLVHSSAIVTWPVMLACAKHPEHMKPRPPASHRGKITQSFFRGVAAIASLAAEEIEKHGQTPHEIPFGALGIYKGIHVEVKRCDLYGCVVLGLNDDVYQGGERSAAWRRLCEVAPDGLVEPSDLNPADFTTKYDEPLQ